ncbi:MAG: HGGxSTG domain-containing protein [Acidobacteriota bacterium]
MRGSYPKTRARHGLRRYDQLHMARTPHWKKPARTQKALEGRIKRLRSPVEQTLLSKIQMLSRALSGEHLPETVDPTDDPDQLIRAEIKRHMKRLCGAKTRQGTPCHRKGLPNGRCRNHGGMSTGAKTPEGKRRALANLRQFRTER